MDNISYADLLERFYFFSQKCPSNKSLFVQIFGENTGIHLLNKLACYNYDVLYWYPVLDHGNRDKLVNYLLHMYDE